MRITNSMMVSQFLTNANNSLNRVNKYQNQVDSTKKVSTISDDPQATITALRARNKLSGLSMYQSNIQTAKSYLAEAESAAGQMNEILQSIYEQVVSAAGSGKNQDNLNAIGEELQNFQNELVSIGNSTLGTVYLFGGFNFTGSTDASGGKTAPFKVDSATGHLYYNGINLTQIACGDDFNSCSQLISGCADKLKAYGEELDSASSDKYARDTLCAQSLETMESLIYNAKSALTAAEKFGVDPHASVGYEQLSAFVDALSGLAAELKDSASLELAGDYILTDAPDIKLTGEGEIDYAYYQEQGIAVLTEEEYRNRFSIGAAREIMGRVNELLWNTDSSVGAGLDFGLAEALTATQGELDAVLDASGARDALAAEAKNQAKVQVGVDNAVNYTFTGLELFGTGQDNIYYILDKCVTMLKAGDTGGLQDMISKIQDAQSHMLNLRTKVGATENRLDLINGRYQSSEANYKEMQSNAVDVDMAEAITNFMTARMVYSAALAAGAEIVQTSLLDFLR